MEFNPKNFIQDCCADLQKYKNDKILILVSGGIDSTTSAALMMKVGIKSELLCIDSGFLRNGEIGYVKNIFEKLSVLHMEDRFIFNLKSKDTALDKRESFRETYFQIINEYVSENNFSAIVQGTQFHKNSTKRYHNSPTKGFSESGIDLIEPVKGLIKEQVRLVAAELGISKQIITRRPFPGPGLLIRFGGEYSSQKVDLIRKITQIVDELVERNKSNFEKCYQIFPYLTDEKVPYVNRENQGSVGSVVLIRAVTCENHGNDIVYKPFMLPEILQNELVSKIMDEEKVARVCFDLTSKIGNGENIKHGATIEYA